MNMKLKIIPKYYRKKKNFNMLFDLCKADINISIYPRNETELIKDNIHDNDRYLLYKNLNQKTKLYLKQIKLLDCLAIRLVKVIMNLLEILFSSGKRK